MTVRRDAHGVPHIEATTQDDLFVAQGYVTAQDRLWQMDASRRNANGDLAEIHGPRARYQHDKTQRVLQIRLTAQRILRPSFCPPTARVSTTMPAASISSSRSASNPTRFPVEFRLLHYRPQPGAASDSISVGL